MKIKKTALLKLILVGLVSFGISGCGDENMFESMADKDSEAAKKEEAKIAIDNGDWQDAIDALQSEWESSGDPDVGADLAAAYMGLAGFDALSLLENAQTTADTPLGSASDDFTLISQILPDQSPENEASMNEAVNILSSIDNRTEDENLQLAMAAASLAILNIGVEWGVDFDANGDPIDAAGNPVTYAFGDVTGITTVMTNISTAVTAVEAAGLVGGGVDVGNQLAILQTDIERVGLDAYLAAIFN